MTEISFGDVFEYSGKEYIFLATTGDIFYIALILNSQDSKTVIRLFNMNLAKNQDYKLDSVLYCFVTLTTKEFKDRCVNFGNPGRDSFSMAVNKLAASLNDKDKRQLRDGILNSRAAPIGLKDLMKSP